MDQPVLSAEAQAGNTSPEFLAGILSFVIDEGSPTIFDLSAVDADGDILTYTFGELGRGGVHGSSQHAWLDTLGDGKVKYYPRGDFNGSDSFAVVVDDGRGGTATMTVNVTVQPVNDAPRFRGFDASFTYTREVPAGGEVTFFSWVVPHDSGLIIEWDYTSISDPEGDPVTFSASTPAHGSVTVDGNVLTYTPDADFMGTDTFQMIVSDDTGASTERQIRVNVGAPRDDEWKIFAPDAFVGAVGGNGMIFGTADAQDITVLDLPGSVVFDSGNRISHFVAGFRDGNDTVRLAGDAASWTVMEVGWNAIFHDGDTYVTMPFRGLGITVIFDDGARGLHYDATVGARIGDQSISAEATQITAAPEGSPPPASDSSSEARLFLEGGAVTAVGGSINVLGTNGAEDISLNAGDIVLDPSFNRGDDIIRFEGAADQYSATRIGSYVLLEGGGTSV